MLRPGPAPDGVEPSAARAAPSAGGRPGHAGGPAGRDVRTDPGAPHRPRGGSSSPAVWRPPPAWSRSARPGTGAYIANSAPVVRRVPITLRRPGPGARRAADRHLLRRAPVGHLRRTAVRAAGRDRQRAAAGRRGDRRRPGRRRASRSCARTSPRSPTWSASRASSSSPATTSTSWTPGPGCGTCRPSASTCCATSGSPIRRGTATFDLAGIDDRTAARSGRARPRRRPRRGARRPGRRDARRPAGPPAGAWSSRRGRPGWTCSCPATPTAASCGPSTTSIRLDQPAVEGLSRHGDTQLYVTAGAGYWGPPMRVGARPEVTVVELRSPRVTPPVRELAAARRTPPR